MSKLRPYQQKAIDDVMQWMSQHDGNPCVVLPTGAGKSHIVAAMCKQVLQDWPETRILMLTHVKELIEQNAAKMREHWPGAPMGIYSASIGKKQLGEPITFAGIQSIRTRAADIGHVDLVIIDECFVAGTKISTPRGDVDIDKVRCGDPVFNARGVGVVEAVSCRQTAETVRVELDNGKSIECTANHPFLTESGWTRAGGLEVGTHLFGIKDVCRLWNDVLSLDQENGERESQVSNAGASVGKAAVLLGRLCEEITPDGAECAGANQDARDAQTHTPSAYTAWRKRAVAAFATACTSPCSGSGMGSGTCDSDQSRTQERCLPECLQGRHCMPRTNDLHRAGRRQSRIGTTERRRQEKRSVSCGPRVVSVSRIKRESDALVFNLQVSGHPSYFADGVAVHNCHLVSHKDEGGYREFLKALKTINPALRVVGLTATPYRLGHGKITDGDSALFSPPLIDNTPIEMLLSAGHLAPLRSKVTAWKYDTEGLHTRGGDFIESELQARVDTEDQNVAVVKEVITLAGERRHWLFFCAGIAHARHIAQALNSLGVVAACVSGETPKAERAQILADFKAGKIKAVTNANVLTTGFDFPDIDLIAMLRPTKSIALYVQMAGRGLRPKSHTDHCMVLDFAGVVMTHGPVTRLNDDANRRAMKKCPGCDEVLPVSFTVCPVCGHEFPAKTVPPEPSERKMQAVKLELQDVDIMGDSIDTEEMDLSGWTWRKHTSRTSGKDTLAVTYYGCLSDKPVTEYLCVTHEGYAGERAWQTVSMLVAQASRKGTLPPGILSEPDNLEAMAGKLSAIPFPRAIRYRQDGKFLRVVERMW